MATKPKKPKTTRGQRSSATATATAAANPSDSQQQNQQRCFHRNLRAFEPSTLNRTERTVQAVLSTEDPVPIYDWRSGEYVDEVLVAAGCQADSSTPLLRDHNQWSVLASLGSVSNVRSSGDEVHGLLTFGRDLGQDVEGVWQRVQQGILRSGSVGYFYERTDYETIPAGESRVINSKTYKAAKSRPKRVVKRWNLLEYSMVVIPADSRATLRSGEPDPNGLQGTGSQAGQELNTTVAPKRTHEDEMKKFLRFLHQHGLAASITNETEALDWARSGNLSADLIAQLSDLCREDNVAFDASQARARESETGTRSHTGNPGNQLPPANNPGDAAAAAVAAERARVAAIRGLHRDHNTVPQTVVDQAIEQGWDLARTQSEFLSALRSSRTPGAPGVQIRGSDQINRRVLQAALMIRNNMNPDSPVLASNTARALSSRRREFDIGWAVGCPQSGQRRDELEQAFDIVYQRGLHDANYMRIAELCCELAEPGRRFYSDEEIRERAFSSGDFSAVFGAVVHMELLSSYERTPHTYQDWCEVVEVGDFNLHKANDMGQVGRLKKMGRNGGNAALLNFEDPLQTQIAAERYAGKLVIDEQTLINDAFGVSGQAPIELGETCQSMVADIALAQLLSTANLSDGRQRFNNTDGNLVTVTGPLTETHWNLVSAAFKNKKVGSRRINVGMAIALAGSTLAPTVRKWMGSNYMSDQMDNPHKGTYSVIEESGVDLGVTDPANDEATIAGTTSSFYVLGTGSKRPIKFAWRRGTGRGPVSGPAINLSTTTDDQWGLAWKVYLDMGCQFQRRVGAVKVVVN